MYLDTSCHRECVILADVTGVVLVPRFMIIGSAKAGTTSLYDDLARLPDTFMPSDKEPDILHRASDIDDALKRYETHFHGAGPGQICGEGSTYYTMVPTFPSVATFARQVCGPDLKIIYLTRDPVARIKSHLAHDFGVGRIRSDDFDKAVREDARYISWSNYEFQLEPWVDAFGTDAILRLSFETFIANRSQEVTKVCQHIGVQPNAILDIKSVSNPRGSQRRPRTPGVSRFLTSDVYRKRLRSLVPQAMKDAGMSLLLSRPSVPEITLSSDTERFIREQCLSEMSEGRA